MYQAIISTLAVTFSIVFVESEIFNNRVRFPEKCIQTLFSFEYFIHTLIRYIVYIVCDYLHQNTCETIFTHLTFWPVFATIILKVKLVSDLFPK